MTPNPNSSSGYADQLAKRLLKREHVAVLAQSRVELEEAAVRYGWQDCSTRSYEPQRGLLAVVDLNTGDIFEVVSDQAQYEGIRETLINYARYPKPFRLWEENKRLERLFFPEYEWPVSGVNPTVLAENVSHWLELLQDGFRFSTPYLELMLRFCHHNELFDHCALVQQHLDQTE